MAKSKNNKLKGKNKKMNPCDQKERSGASLKRCYSFAFALILTGCILRIVPCFLDIALYGIAGWLCVYAAACVFAGYSYLLGNQYGVGHLVAGAAGITLALLLSEVDVKSYLQSLDPSLLSKIDVETLILELFVLVLIFLGAWGIVLGIWTFIRDVVEQKKQQCKLHQETKNQYEDASDAEMNIGVKDASECLGLLFVILQIVYFFIERNT